MLGKMQSRRATPYNDCPVQLFHLLSGDLAQMGSDARKKLQAEDVQLSYILWTCDFAPSGLSN